MDYTSIRYTRSVNAVSVSLPASKSISNRTLILNSLAPGGSIANIARCDDTDAMLRALADDKATKVDIGAAGTAMRFLTAYFATREGRTVTIDGTERMRRRPIALLVDALRSLGADISYDMEEGYPPLTIRGCRLETKRELSLCGNVSSQYISALMMIAPLMGGLIIRIEGGLISRPYVEMTASLMGRYGADVKIDGTTIKIQGTGYRPSDLTVESDWSAASYWYEIKALAPDLNIRLKGLSKESMQGDSRIKDMFRKLGVTTEFCGSDAILGFDSELRSNRLDIDLSEQPDLAQTFVVTACMLGIPFRITGLSTLKIKETDRIAALQNELLKLGFRLTEEDGNALTWHGKKNTPCNLVEIDTYKDHRMAMAFAPAAIVHPSITIRDAAVVSKSYPDYWRHLANAGFSWEVRQ